MLWLPSSGMAALRRCQRRGVDLQREAIAAVLDDRHGSARRQDQRDSRGLTSDARQQAAQPLLRERLAHAAPHIVAAPEAEPGRGFFSRPRASSLSGGSTDAQVLEARQLRVTTAGRYMPFTCRHMPLHAVTCEAAAGDDRWTLHAVP